MKTFQSIAAALLIGTIAITLAGCDQDGPFEESGEAVDDALDDAGDTIEGSSASL